MEWIKATVQGRTIWIRPAHVIYAQDVPSTKDIPRHSFEIVAPGGAFVLIDEDEIANAKKILGLR